MNFNAEVLHTAPNVESQLRAAVERAEANVAALLRLVEEQNIPIDVGDYDSRTPLHLAAGEGRQVLLSTLYSTIHAS